jgi:RNA polymerase sigma-70 factor (ECF subfamily)
MLGSVADSQDAVQETFLTGLAQIATLRDDRRFAGWIAQIARNLCRDLIRRRSRHRALLEQHHQDRQPPAPRSDTFLPAREDFATLHAALAQLPEKHRLPLMLFYFDGQSTRRLARELGISQAGACTRLSRARRELRELLREQEGAR